MCTLRIAAGLCVALLLSACGTSSPTGTIGVLPSDSPLSSETNSVVLAAVGNAMPVGAETPPPFGFVGFCQRHPDECAGSSATPSTWRLTDARRRELEEVNLYVNRTVRAVEDAELYNKPEWWTYPGSQGGDCEDFVLLKRRMLMERGWPADALLISVVRERSGAGHAVLLVVTDAGELVLDNKTRHIRNWRETPYTWVKRQSRHHPYVWVRTGNARGGKTASLDLPAEAPALPATDQNLRPSLAS